MLLIYEKMEDINLTKEEIIDKNDSNHVFKHLYPDFEKTHAKLLIFSHLLKKPMTKLLVLVRNN